MIAADKKKESQGNKALSTNVVSGINEAVLREMEGEESKKKRSAICCVGRNAPLFL